MTIIKHIKLDPLQDQLSDYLQLLDAYLGHDASTVRQITSSAVHQLISKDTSSDLRIVRATLEALVARWSVDIPGLEEMPLEESGLCSLQWPVVVHEEGCHTHCLLPDIPRHAPRSISLPLFLSWNFFFLCCRHSSCFWFLVSGFWVVFFLGSYFWEVQIAWPLELEILFLTT